MGRAERVGRNGGGGVFLIMDSRVRFKGGR